MGIIEWLRVFIWKHRKFQTGCPFCGGSYELKVTATLQSITAHPYDDIQEVVTEKYRENEFRCKRKWDVKVPGHGFIEFRDKEAW